MPEYLAVAGAFSSSETSCSHLWVAPKFANCEQPEIGKIPARTQPRFARALLRKLVTFSLERICIIRKVSLHIVGQALTKSGNKRALNLRALEHTIRGEPRIIDNVTKLTGLTGVQRLQRVSEAVYKSHVVSESLSLANSIFNSLHKIRMFGANGFLRLGRRWSSSARRGATCN